MPELNDKNMQKQNALKSLNILHKALLMGQVFFAAVCVFMIYTKAAEPALKELEKILQVIALVMTLGGIFAGIAAFKKKLLQIREMQTDAEAKFSLYRSALILQWALLEGPSIFCIICFFSYRQLCFSGAGYCDHVCFCDDGTIKK